MILAGDIGGTNTRLAVFQDDGETLVRQQVFKNKGRSSFLDIAREFLGQQKGERIDRAAFGVAGAVRGGVVNMTNLGWTLVDPELERELKIPNVALINDMVDHGENISRLRGDQVGALGGVKHHLVALERLHVVAPAADLERRVAVEAVPARRAPTLHVLDGERHHLAVEQAHD